VAVELLEILRLHDYLIGAADIHLRIHFHSANLYDLTAKTARESLLHRKCLLGIRLIPL
jgi:hypothetical protein